MDRERHLERLSEARAGAHARKVPVPIRIRRLEVLRSTRLTPGMVRVTLGGPEAAGVEHHAPDDHVKLVFPEKTGELRVPEPDGLTLNWPRPLPPTREYTIRRYDPDAGEIDIDFVVHQGGLASDWALGASPGDEAWVAGPPGSLVVPDGYDRYLLAGDATALPAIAARLETLPAAARGWAIVEVADASEEIELAGPAGVTVTWVHRDGVAAGQDGPLADAVRAVDVRGGESVFAWVAGEAGAIRPLRQWLREDLGLARDDHLVSGYWKRGVVEYDEDDDGHDHDHDHDHD